MIKVLHLIFATVPVAIIILVAACGSAVSSHSAVTAACVERERHIVERDSGPFEDQVDINKLRDACDQLIKVIEEIRKP